MRRARPCGRRDVSDAGHGKPTTTVVTYALLWIYGPLDGLGTLADPSRDAEGMTLGHCLTVPECARSVAAYYVSDPTHG
jgi:hypothetical protein